MPASGHCLPCSTHSLSACASHPCLSEVAAHLLLLLPALLLAAILLSYYTAPDVSLRHQLVQLQHVPTHPLLLQW